MPKRQKNFLKLVGIMSFVGLTSPALAQTNSTSVDPMTIQVSGVNLGMSVADSIAALQKFDPSYKIEKLYEFRSGARYGDTGAPLGRIPQSSQDDTTLPQKYAFLTDLTATDGIDHVHVWYSPVPGKETVIAIVRQEQYKPQPDATEQLEQQNPMLFAPMLQNSNQKPAPQLPALSAVEAGVVAKYPYPYTLRSSDNLNTDWLFDSKGRLISPARAQQLDLGSWGGELPGSVSPASGIGLSVSITAESSGLVDILSMSLFDGAGLYNSVGQMQADYEAGKIKLDAAIQSSAVQSGPKTNF